MTPNLLYAYCQYIGDNHEKLLLLNINCIILTVEKVDKIIVKKFYDHIFHAIRFAITMVA